MDHKGVENFSKNLYPKELPCLDDENMMVDSTDDNFEQGHLPLAEPELLPKRIQPTKTDDDCYKSNRMKCVEIKQNTSKHISTQKYPVLVPPPIAESASSKDEDGASLSSTELDADTQTSDEQKINKVQANQTSQPDTNKVHYISSDEDEYNSNLQGKFDPECKKSFSKTYATSGARNENSGVSYQRYGTHVTSYASSSTGSKNYYGGQRQITYVDNISLLSKLGKWKVLQKDQVKCQEIYKYVHNSYNVPETQLDVKIYGIHELDKSSVWNFNIFPNGKSKKSETSPKTLLWFKTTSDSVRKLADKTDTCIAFYDRVARAFSKNLKEIHKPFRQIIILCEVSLGKRHKSPVGFQYWSKRAFPPGSDSIKSEGIYVPKIKQADDSPSIVIPNNKTTQDSGSMSKSLLFNEYLVNEANRVEVRYAVDMEVTPYLYSATK